MWDPQESERLRQEGGKGWGSGLWGSDEVPQGVCPFPAGPWGFLLGSVLWGVLLCHLSFSSGLTFLVIAGCYLSDFL